MSKYPELTSDRLSPGVTYMTAYQRLERGWSFERAVSAPARQRRRGEAALVAYHKRLRLKSLRAEAKLHAPPKPKTMKVRKRYSPRRTEDTSPRYIRRIREAFCAEFIKTGELNQTLMRQLEAYAHAMRAPKVDLAGVPDEPTAQDRGQEGSRYTNNRSGDAHSVDRQTARRIADFLRT